MPSTRYGSVRDKQYRRAIDTWEYRLATSQLIGQDRIYAGPGQVPTYPERMDLPGRQKPVVDQRLLATRTLHDVSQSDVFYIGYDRIYGGPGQVPQQAFPNPSLGYTRPSDLRIYFESELPLQLGGQDSLYGAPGQVPTYPFPNPSLGYPRAPDLRLYFESELPLQLQAQDRIYAGPGQVPTYAFPNPPLGYRRPTDLRWEDTLLPMLLVGQDRIYAGPGQVPTYAFPNPPLGYQRVIDLRTFAQSYLPYIPLFTAPPFVPVDLPNPSLGYMRPSILRLFSTPIPQSTPDSVLAFIPVDIQNPSRGYVRTIDLRSFSVSPIPPTTASPFTTVDLPNPSLGYPRLSALRIFSTPIPQSTADAVNAFIPVDIQNPSRGYIRLSDLRVFSVSSPVPPSTGSPFATVDLPNPPLGYPRLSALRIFSTPIPQSTADAVMAFIPADLPNPSLGYRRALDLRIYSLLSQPITPAPAFTPVDFPNPSRGYIRPSDVSPTYLDLLNWTLLAQDRIYGAPGQVPTYDWQMALPPRGYAPPRPFWIHASDIQLAGQDQLPLTNYDSATKLPPYFLLPRRIREPSTNLGAPIQTNLLIPIPPLRMSSLADLLPPRGYPRALPSTYSIAQGPRPFSVVVVQSDLTLEAWLFVPDVNSTALLWVPDTSFGVSLQNPDATFQGLDVGED